LPFDLARTFESCDAERADFRRLDAAAANFASDHPYVLFHRAAIERLRRAATGNGKLWTRFARALRQPSPPTDLTDIREAVKGRARRLIVTAFVALVAEGWHRDEALLASRAALREVCSAATWKERSIIRSFLDCGETAVAVALAYDWLYDQLSPDERRDVEESLRCRVLTPALLAYEDKSLLWPKRRDNCCMVSNSGIMTAALAMLRVHRALASALLQHGLSSAWNAFAAFAPDGAWPEGLSYWSLSVRHAGLIVAALESTLGDSFGLSDRPGLATTGDFALHAAGPFGAAFDFGDSTRSFDVAALAWLAHRFRRPVDGWLLGDYDGWHLPFELIWPAAEKTGPVALGLPTGKVFRGADLACFRNTWRSNTAGSPVFLAIKGGNSTAAGSASPARPEERMLHAQADAGSFVIDGARYRWAVDLGGDDYDLPGYFDHGADGRSGPRWQYYRACTAGHNTLVIDGLNQDPRAPASILGSSVEGGCKWVVYDLSAAYGRPAGSVRRGAALIGRQVVIADEIDPDIRCKIVWAMHTSAEPVRVVGAHAVFRHGEDRLVARILEPVGARFALAMLPAPRSFARADVWQLHGRPQARRHGAKVRELARREDDGDRRGVGVPIRRLQIAVPAGTRQLTVLLLPDCAEEDDPPLPVAPLDYWLARRPLRLAPCAASATRMRRRKCGGDVAVSCLGAAIERPPHALQSGERA
jgi:hypothetical protein